MKSVLKCPKCNCKDLVIYEEYLASKSFLQCDGEIDTSTANGEYGEIIRMTAICTKCNHYWTVRGRIQIDELEEKQ